MNTFRPGQTVWLEQAGERCEIRKFIGSGDRGQIYLASIDEQECAMKWYFPQSATREQREAVERLVQKGPPNDRFIWPLDIALCPDEPSFGYMIPLLQPRYRSLAELMTREIDPTFQTLTTVGLELADSFLRLHSLGLCYTDISFNTLFFDPITGEIAICKNDTVILSGEDGNGGPGTLRFLAPEIIRGESKPNVNTDLYSLSVLLFYLLMIHHPLEGRREKEINCLDLAAMQKLYGKEPLFIFDPKHGANRPDPRHS